MSAAPHPLLEVTPPRFSQARSRQSYEALVVAAKQVFSLRGFDGAQTPEIASLAKVSVGTFYRYFTDKREVLLEVFRRDMAEAYQEVMAKLRPENFELTERKHTLDNILTIAIGHVSQDKRMHQLYLEMSLRDPEFSRIRNVFDHEAIARIALLIPAVCPPGRVSDPNAMAAILYTTVRDCAMAISGAHGGLPIDRARGQAALAEMLHRTLYG